MTTYSYDGAGRLQGLSLPGGRRLSYSYSGGRLSSITDALGNAISYSYDGLGRQSARELRDPENRLRYSLRFAYDQAGNLAKRMYGDNSEEQFAYDPVANLVRAVDPLGVVSEYGYDGLRRVLTEKRAGEQIAGYGYDSQDNIIGVTDARSHVTTSVYDDFGRELGAGPVAWNRSGAGSCRWRATPPPVRCRASNQKSCSPEFQHR